MSQRLLSTTFRLVFGVLKEGLNKGGREEGRWIRLFILNNKLKEFLIG